jgi:hypothetical protein
VAFADSYSNLSTSQVSPCRHRLTWAIAILAVAICVTVLSACSDSATTTAPRSTFQWHPDAGSPYGADAASRRALGIVDGYNGTLFFRAPSADASGSYSLWSLDEQTQERREMAPDCGGMINASADAVYYVGKDGKDVYRFDLKTTKASVVLSGDFQTMLSVKGHLLYVKSDGMLYTALVSAQTGDKALVVENAVPEYVECIGDYVYFAQLKPGGGSTLLRMTVGSPGELTTIRDVRGYPLKYLGTRVLCRDGETVYLVDLDIGKETVVTSDEGTLSSAAANGNGVFYIKTDSAGKVV